MPDGQPSHTCPTHGIAAALSCARCGSFVCPRCELKEADVGVVCADCTAHVGPPRWVSRNAKRAAWNLVLLIANAVFVAPMFSVGLFETWIRKANISNSALAAVPVVIILSAVAGCVAAIRASLSPRLRLQFFAAGLQALAGLLLTATNGHLGSDGAVFSVLVGILATGAAGVIAITAILVRRPIRRPDEEPWRRSQLLR